MREAPRRCVLVLSVCVTLVLGVGVGSAEGPSASRVYTDPGNRFSIGVPAGWSATKAGPSSPVRGSAARLTTGTSTQLHVVPSAAKGTATTMAATTHEKLMKKGARLVKSSAVAVASGERADLRVYTVSGAVIISAWVVRGERAFQLVGTARQDADAQLGKTLVAIIRSFNTSPKPGEGDRKQPLEVPPPHDVAMAISEANAGHGTVLAGLKVTKTGGRGRAKGKIHFDMLIFFNSHGEVLNGRAKYWRGKRDGSLEPNRRNLITGKNDLTTGRRWLNRLYQIEGRFLPGGRFEGRMTPVAWKGPCLADPGPRDLRGQFTADQALVLTVGDGSSKLFGSLRLEMAWGPWLANRLSAKEIKGLRRGSGPLVYLDDQRYNRP